MASERFRLKLGFWPVGLTVKLCVTEGAAAQVMLSPSCEATMVQLLAEVSEAKVTAAPTTLHTEVVVEM